ncbi:MAG: RNA-binding protein [Proteobacteria bacterium]|nr:RNA-binding protein [Pseudomonadota bacterium]
MEKKLYAGNLSYSTTEDDLRQLFSQYGDVESVKLITDKETGRPKGFGFVAMGSEEAAQKAVAELNGTSFMERTITVAEAQPEKPRENRGFGGNRGGFGGDRGDRGGFDRGRGGRGPGRGGR